MNTKKEFYKNQPTRFYDHNKVIKDGVLTVKTNGLPDVNNKYDELIETFTPYEKVVEVDGLTLKIGLIKYKAKYIDKFGKLRSTEEKTMFLDEQHKRDVLWWHTEAQRNSRYWQASKLYADVLHDLDLSDSEFIKKYFIDLGRRDAGRISKPTKWQGVLHGSDEFYKDYEIKRRKK